MAARKLPQSDPLDAARLELAKLRDADDWDEPTGRTEVTVNLHNPHPPQPSQPQIELAQPTPGVWTIAFTAVKRLTGWKLVAAIAITALAVLRWFGKL